MRALVFLLVLSCCTEPPPCTELGCPEAPSGSPDAWEPCTGETCWCPTDDGPAACEVAP